MFQEVGLRASFKKGGPRLVTATMRLTAHPELLPVVQAFVARMAEQLSFAESERMNLKQALQYACRRPMSQWESNGEHEIALEFKGFADRLEIVLELPQEGTETPEPDSYLLSQVLDRVVEEETPEERYRMTLVKYHAGRGENREG